MQLDYKLIIAVWMSFSLFSCGVDTQPAIEEGNGKENSGEYYTNTLSKAELKCDVCDSYSYTRYNTQEDILFSDEEIAAMIGSHKVQEFKNKMTKDPQAQYALSLDMPELLEDGEIKGRMLMVVSDRLVGIVNYYGTFLRLFSEHVDGLIKIESYSDSYSGGEKQISSSKQENIVSFKIVPNGIKLRNMTLTIPIDLDNAIFIGESTTKWAANNATQRNPVENEEVDADLVMDNDTYEVDHSEGYKNGYEDSTDGSISKSTSTEEQKVDKNYLITENTVGIFEIGESIPFPNNSKAYKITKEIQTRMTEEGEYEETVFVVSEKGQELLYLKLDYDYQTGTYTDEIGEIIILTDKYKTKEGVGVNSTIEDFIQKYPSFNLWYTYVSETYVIECDYNNVQFILDEKDFIGEMDITSDMTILKRSDFKKGSKIMKIRLY